MDRESVMGRGSLPLPASGDYVIRLENVSFKHPGASFFALEDINIALTSGKKYAIVGENGSGKSTFMMLLQRLYDPTEGRITLNGIDIKAFDYGAYLAAFSPVFQDFALHEFSIGENIAFDSPKEKRIWELLDINRLGNNIRSSPHGLDTYLTKTLSEEGIDFSGGQRQRLALARSEFKQSAAMVWDEPTSSLDPRSEDEVFTQFKQFSQDKLGIYVSHRMSSTRLSDEILLFDKGRIPEQGTYNALIAQNGLYAKAFALQSDYYNKDQ